MCVRNPDSQYEFLIKTEGGDEQRASVALAVRISQRSMLRADDRIRSCLRATADSGDTQVP